MSQLKLRLLPGWGLAWFRTTRGGQGKDSGLVHPRAVLSQIPLSLGSCRRARPKQGFSVSPESHQFELRSGISVALPGPNLIRTTTVRIGLCCPPLAIGYSPL